ncbi:MAG: hypothetical protein CMK59_14830, partial [Proteobacteria bacterium]|nr:hypothetical protein [Pseudomonadota bacterium]
GWFELIVPSLFDPEYRYSDQKDLLSVNDHNEWRPEYTDTICKVLSFGKKFHNGTIVKAAVHVVL